MKEAALSGEQLGQTAFENCWDAYTGAGDQKETSSFHPDLSGNQLVQIRRIGISGITDDPPGAPTNEFREDYNQVILRKCGMDRFMGNATWNQNTGLLYFHGRKMLKAMFKDLNRKNGTITNPDIHWDLSDLSDATDIIVAGQSGGAGGMIMNLEWLKARLDTIAPTADIRFVLDARMHPFVESESHFEDGGSPKPMYGLTGHDRDGTTTLHADTGSGTKTLDRSADTFKPGGEFRLLLDSWGYPSTVNSQYLDMSCMNQHRPHEEFRFDEQHVLLNHTKENVFLHQTLQDHTHEGSATPLFWDDNNYPGMTWKPNFTEERRARIIYQADRYYEDRSNAHERLDATELGIYIADGDQHVTIWDNSFGAHTVSKGGTVWNLHDAIIERRDNGDLCAVDDTAGYLSETMTDPACGGWDTDWVP